jgi:hypothetical protein
MNSMNVSMVDLQGVTDVERIVEALLGDDRPMGSPGGYVLSAEVRPELEQTLVGVAKEIRRRRLHPPLMLIGVDHNREALRTVMDAWDTTILVDPGQERLIPDLQEFLPALFGNWSDLGTCGSAMLYKVNVDGIRPRSESSAADIERELCLRTFPVLHQLAEVDYPDFYTVAVPGDYTSLAVDALGRQGPVIDIQGTNQSEIRVGGFVFDDVSDTLDDRFAAMQEARSPPAHRQSASAEGEGDGQTPESSGRRSANPNLNPTVELQQISGDN